MNGWSLKARNKRGRLLRPQAELHNRQAAAAAVAAAVPDDVMQTRGGSATVARAAAAWEETKSRWGDGREANADAAGRNR